MAGVIPAFPAWRFAMRYLFERTFWWGLVITFVAWQGHDALVK